MNINDQIDDYLRRKQAKNQGGFWSGVKDYSIGAAKDAYSDPVSLGRVPFNMVEGASDFGLNALAGASNLFGAPETAKYFSDAASRDIVAEAFGHQPNKVDEISKGVGSLFTLGGAAKLGSHAVKGFGGSARAQQIGQVVAPATVGAFSGVQDVYERTDGDPNNTQITVGAGAGASQVLPLGAVFGKGRSALGAAAKEGGQEAFYESAVGGATDTFDPYAVGAATTMGGVIGGSIRGADNYIDGRTQPPPITTNGDAGADILPPTPNPFADDNIRVTDTNAAPPSMDDILAAVKRGEGRLTSDPNNPMKSMYVPNRLALPPPPPPTPDIVSDYASGEIPLVAQAPTGQLRQEVYDNPYGFSMKNLADAPMPTPPKAQAPPPSAPPPAPNEYRRESINPMQPPPAGILQTPGGYGGIFADPNYSPIPPFGGYLGHSPEPTPMPEGEPYLNAPPPAPNESFMDSVTGARMAQQPPIFPNTGKVINSATGINNAPFVGADDGGAPDLPPPPNAPRANNAGETPIIADKQGGRDAKLSGEFGRNVYDDSVPLDQINTDAQTYQFRADQNEKGTSGRLQDAERAGWKDSASGKVWLHQRNDGKIYVADGHHRVDLAKRLGDKAPKNLDAYVFKETDGWTAKEVRREAAMKNLREGNGTAADNALALQDMSGEEIDALGLPQTRALEYGRQISRLSQPALDYFIQHAENRKGDGIAPGHAAAVGQIVSDPNKQIPALAMMLEAKPANKAQAEVMANEANNLGITQNADTQEAMFGTNDVSNAVNKGKVFDGAMKVLARNKNALNTVVNNVGTIGSVAGNSIDAQGTQDEAQNIDRSVEYLKSEALASGTETNRILNEIVDRTDFNERGAVGKAVDELVAELSKKKIERPVETDAYERTAQAKANSDARIQPTAPQKDAGGIFDETQTQQTDIADFARGDVGINRGNMEARYPEFRATMERVLGKRTADRIDLQIGVLENGALGAHYAPQTDALRTIILNMDMADTDAQPILGHELIHAARDLGVFTDAEWRSLVNTARNNPSIAERVKSLYPAIDDEAQLDEEMVARLAQEYAARPRQGIIQRAVTKLMELLRGVRSLFTGDLSGDDIMRGFYEGRYADKASYIEPIFTYEEATEPDFAMGDNTGGFGTGAQSAITALPKAFGVTVISDNKAHSGKAKNVVRVPAPQTGQTTDMVAMEIINRVIGTWARNVATDSEIGSLAKVFGTTDRSEIGSRLSGWIPRYLSGRDEGGDVLNALGGRRKADMVKMRKQVVPEQVSAIADALATPRAMRAESAHIKLATDIANYWIPVDRFLKANDATEGFIAKLNSLVTGTDTPHNIGITFKNNGIAEWTDDGWVLKNRDTTIGKDVEMVARKSALTERQFYDGLHNYMDALHEDTTKAELQAGEARFTPAQRANILRDTPDDVKHASQAIRKTFDDMLSASVDAGLIKREEADKMLATHPNYVPRKAFDFQDFDLFNDGLGMREIYKEREGGFTKSDNPYIAVTSRMTAVARLAYQNMALRDLVGTASDFGGAEILKQEIKVGRGQAKWLERDGDGVIVRYLDNGNTHIARVTDPDLVSSLSMLGYVTPPSKFRKIMRETKTMLTTLISATPGFQLRNTAKEIISQQFMGRVGGGALGLNASAGGSLVKHAIDPSAPLDDTIAQYFLSGGIAGRAAHDGELLAGGGSPGAVGLPAKMVADIKRATARFNSALTAPDIALRTSIFQRGLDDGKSFLEAANYANETMNYSRRGASKTVRATTDIVPYLNPYLQEIPNMARRFATLATDAKAIQDGTATKAQKERMMRGMVTLGALVAIASLAHAEFGDDDERRGVSMQQRARGIPFYDDKGNRYNVPTPFGIGGVTNALALAMRGEWDLAGKSLKYQMLNPPTTFPLLGAIESFDPTKTNKTLSGYNITPSAQQKLANKDKHTESPTLDKIAHTIKANPHKLNHFVRSFFGDAPMIILSLVDGATAQSPRTQLSGQLLSQWRERNKNPDYSLGIESYYSPEREPYAKGVGRIRATTLARELGGNQQAILAHISRVGQTDPKHANSYLIGFNTDRAYGAKSSPTGITFDKIQKEVSTYKKDFATLYKSDRTTAQQIKRANQQMMRAVNVLAQIYRTDGGAHAPETIDRLGRRINDIGNSVAGQKELGRAIVRILDGAKYSIYNQRIDNFITNYGWRTE